MKKKYSILVMVICISIMTSFSFLKIHDSLGYTPGFRENWFFTSRFINIDSDPLVVDLDLDNNEEILFTSGNQLYCVDEYGEQKWMKDEYVMPSMGFVSSADIYYDEKLEVFFSAGPRLFVLDHNGWNRWSYTFPDYVTSKTTVCDIDNDGLSDALITCDDGKLYCLDSLGNQKWNFTLSTSLDMEYSTIKVVDFDGDNFYDIIVGGGVLSRSFFCLNHNGTIRWEKSFGSISQFELVDLDFDDIPEIIAPTSDGYVVALNSAGDIIWSYYTMYYMENPVISDITGDNLPEILLLDYSPFGLSSLYCFSSLGIQLWNKTVNNISNKEVTIIDLNQDGVKEILYSTYSEGLVCLDNSSKKISNYDPGGHFSTNRRIVPYNQSAQEVNLLFADGDGLYSLRTYYKGIFYGGYLFPVYLGGLGLVIGLIVFVDKGFKSGRFKFKSKTYKYIDEDGQEIYLEKEV